MTAARQPAGCSSDAAQRRVEREGSLRILANTTRSPVERERAPGITTDTAGELHRADRVRSAMPTVSRRSFASLVAAAFACMMSLPAHADDYRIGVLHVERILQQSAPAKAALERIQQEFKARDAELVQKEQEVRDAAAQLEKVRATLPADERATRERALEARTREVERQRQVFAEDLRTRQFQELDKLKVRLDRVLTAYAKERNYDLILQDALFVGRSVDITDDIIKALSATP
jgi:outer membrane protein